MHLLLGIVSLAAGAAYLAMAIRDGYASDKSGWIIARRDTKPFAYWSNVILFALLVVVGIGLIMMSFNE